MNVLIIKISSMGDILHTLPAVTDASYAIPNISFDWVIENAFMEIPGWHPAVDRVISIKLRFWKKNWYKYSSWKEYYQYIELLKIKNYDLVIDAQGLLKTSIFSTRIARGRKCGMDFSSSREFISSYFLNQSYCIKKYQHAITRMRQLFAYSLKYSVPESMGEYKINDLFPRRMSGIPYLIFFHATTQLKKHWIESNWNILIQYANNLGYYVKLPCWTKQEILLSKRLSSENYGWTVILSRLTLNQIAMQISQATAVISVDTGFSHLTAALNCPSLTLYGPTNPALIGVYGLNQKILYSKTKDMKSLTVFHVWKVFKKILDNYS